MALISVLEIDFDLIIQIPRCTCLPGHITGKNLGDKHQKDQLLNEDPLIFQSMKAAVRWEGDHIFGTEGINAVKLIMFVHSTKVPWTTNLFLSKFG